MNSWAKKLQSTEVDAPFAPFIREGMGDLINQPPSTSNQLPFSLSIIKFLTFAIKFTWISYFFFVYYSEFHNS
jgi:hypothetical protein